MKILLWLEPAVSKKILPAAKIQKGVTQSTQTRLKLQACKDEHKRSQRFAETIQKN